MAVPLPTPFLDALQDSYTSERALGILFLGFGLMALFLAAVGLTGVISQTSIQRTREIGIRMALGAHPSRIAQEIIQESLLLVGVGLLVGASMGWELQKFLSGQLFGLSSIEIHLYVDVLSVMALIALASALGPALRAARFDPSLGLRSE